MAIKSFQGRRAAPEKIQSAPIMVSDYMTTDLITFTADQSVVEVMQVLVDNKIHGGPVVNENGELQGIISDADCMKQISEGRYFNMPMGDIKVRDYMTTTVSTITTDLNIFDCASLFDKHNTRRFPVLQDGKLVGQISRMDILRAALEIRAHNWHI